MKPKEILKVATQIHLYGGDAIQYVKNHPDSFPELVDEAGDMLLKVERKVPASLYIEMEAKTFLVQFMDSLTQADITQIEMANFGLVCNEFLTSVDLGWNKEFLPKPIKGFFKPNK